MVLVRPNIPTFPETFLCRAGSQGGIVDRVYGGATGQGTSFIVPEHLVVTASIEAILMAVNRLV